MISSGNKKLDTILVSDPDKFTPYSDYLDWIFEFGGSECSVGY